MEMIAHVCDSCQIQTLLQIPDQAFMVSVQFIPDGWVRLRIEMGTAPISPIKMIGAKMQQILDRMKAEQSGAHPLVEMSEAIGFAMTEISKLTRPDKICLEFCPTCVQNLTLEMNGTAIMPRRPPAPQE